MNPSWQMKICVFCGSSAGHRAEYTKATESLAEVLSDRKIKVVYGGGSIGLMGVLARSVLRNSGQESLHGIIPNNLASLETTALPGGIGTLEELLETLTWLSIDIHSKPIGLLNVGGFYSKLIDLFKHLAKEGFLSPRLLDCLVVSDKAEELVRKLHEQYLQNE